MLPQLSRLRASTPSGLLNILPPLHTVTFEPHDWPRYIPFRLHIGTFTDPDDPQATDLPVWAYLALKNNNRRSPVTMELGAHADLGGDDEMNWEIYYENIRHFDKSDEGNEVVQLFKPFTAEMSRSDLFALVKYYFMLGADCGLFPGEGITYNESFAQSMRAICRRMKRGEEKKRAHEYGGESYKELITCAIRDSSVDDEDADDDADTEEETVVKSLGAKRRTGKGKSINCNLGIKPFGGGLQEYLALRKRVAKTMAARHVPKPAQIGREPLMKRQHSDIDTSTDESGENDGEQPAARNGLRRTVVRHAKRLARSRLQNTGISERNFSNEGSSSCRGENYSDASDVDSIPSRHDYFRNGAGGGRSKEHSTSGRRLSHLPSAIDELSDEAEVEVDLSDARLQSSTIGQARSAREYPTSPAHLGDLTSDWKRRNFTLPTGMYAGAAKRPLPGRLRTRRGLAPLSVFIPTTPSKMSSSTGSCSTCSESSSSGSVETPHSRQVALITDIRHVRNVLMRLESEKLDMDMQVNVTEGTADKKMDGCAERQRRQSW